MCRGRRNTIHELRKVTERAAVSTSETGATC